MQYRPTLIIAAIFALMLIHNAYAAFPYDATWLSYADKRLVYQIDTSGITSNTANVYVTVSIDPTTLQNYINRWSSYCDSSGKYDWFWPTFTYASTSNNTERMLQIVEYNNWQTFTVGSCGTVDLPTSYVLKLPNGVLDGGDSYANYQHYIYAYLKYPYVDDFYDNPIDSFPEEYWNYAGTPSTNTRVRFDHTFGKGHYLYLADGATYRRSFTFSIDLTTNAPTMVCVGGAGEDLIDLFFVIDGNTVLIKRNAGCVNAEDVLRNKGYSGTLTVSAIDIKRTDYGIFDPMYWYYWWVIPESAYRQIVYGS